MEMSLKELWENFGETGWIVEGNEQANKLANATATGKNRKIKGDP